MQKLAKQLLAIAIRVNYPKLNILAIDGGVDSPMYVMAEEVPQSSNEVLTYMVGVFDLDTLPLEPRKALWKIPTLEKAQIIFEEAKRSGL